MKPPHSSRFTLGRLCRRGSPWCFAFLGATAMLSSAGRASDEGQIIERIVASVDDKIILLSEVNSVVEDILQVEPAPPGTDGNRYEETRRREVLDTLITEKLLETEVERLRIEVSKEEIDRIVENTKQQYKLDDAKLRQALAQQGLTLDEYRDGLRKQMLKAKIIQLKVKNRVQVTDQDVASTYAQRQALDAQEYRVRARHILFVVPAGGPEEEALAKAEAAKRRVLAGEDFSSLANELSEGPTAKNGGALGVFGRGEMVPEFERAAFSAVPGQVVGPVRTQFGWHLILVEERVALAQAPLEQVQDELRNRLYEEEVERAFRGYVEELRRKANIEIRL
ncbi:MAG: foldase protein PrsA [Myxococcota bacterium]